MVIEKENVESSNFFSWTFFHLVFFLTSTANKGEKTTIKKKKKKTLVGKEGAKPPVM